MEDLNGLLRMMKGAEFGCIYFEDSQIQDENEFGACIF